MKCLAHALFENDSKPEHVIFTTYRERNDSSTRIGKKDRHNDCAVMDVVDEDEE